MRTTPLNPRLRQQSTARPLSEAETALSAALQTIFAENVHDFAAVAASLEARGVKRPSGTAGAWSAAVLASELEAINADLDAAYARDGIGA